LATTERQRKAYKFLLERARSKQPFNMAELCSATGWAENTADTYLKKQARSVVSKKSGKYTVAQRFIYLSEDDFVKKTSQKESILPSYSRTSYDSVLVYEFLMPLTREELLKLSLDRLFYRDSLETQLNLLDEATFHSVIPRKASDSDPIYVARIAQTVSRYFGGYSIIHASGRFRADGLCTQLQAVGKRYIIDETTAIVRFIIPLKQSSKTHGELFDPKSAAIDKLSEPLKAEIELVRTLFFSIFAEVVVHSIQGEDQIWLVETLNGSQKLYTWEVVSDEN